MLRSGIGLSLLAALAACRVEDAPEKPIDDHVALCCKAEAGESLTYTGCRPSSHCRTVETLWVRGPMQCGPVEAERCQGGRCCSLEQSAPADPPPEPASETPAAEAVEIPRPAPIEPMPFEPR